MDDLFSVGLSLRLAELEHEFCTVNLLVKTKMTFSRNMNLQNSDLIIGAENNFRKRQFHALILFLNKFTSQVQFWSRNDADRHEMQESDHVSHSHVFWYQRSTINGVGRDKDSNRKRSRNILHDPIGASIFVAATNVEGSINFSYHWLCWAKTHSKTYWLRGGRVGFAYWLPIWSSQIARIYLLQS